MTRFKTAAVVLVVGLAVAVPAAVLLAQNTRAPQESGNRAQQPQAEQRPAVAVTTAKAVRKPMPVRLDAIGSVQAVATVTVHSRVDSQILEASVTDGAVVKEGDVLFRLDARQIEAQLKQAQANLERDRAALDFAQSDLKRQEELAKRDYASAQKLETARSSAAGLVATLEGDQAAIDNLRVQLTYYTITAPIPGRIGAVGLKAGNIARSADTAAALAVINQVMPIYVSFTIPQRYLPDIRQAMRTGSAKVRATPQGYEESSEGAFAFIDNAVDATTGTITIRATFENKDELLWPGQLCAVRATLRVEPNAVAVPREAIQSGQTGTFVFVVDNAVAHARKVVVDRNVGGESVIKSGLDGGETVVTDGQLLLTEGARVAPRNQSAGPQADDAGRGKATL